MAKISVAGLNYSAIITEAQAYYYKASKKVDLAKSTSGADDIYGGNGTDYIEAGNGNDNVAGGNGKDTVYGGFGNDTLYGDDKKNLDLTENGADVIYGGSGNDTIFGGNGADTLYGDERDTGTGALITAGATVADAVLALYKDTIDGGNGSDRIIGGLGGDTLTGAFGPDTFVYDRIADSRSTAGEGAENSGTSALDWQAETGDYITDFTKGSDQLDFTTLNGLNAALNFSGTTPEANGIWYLIAGGNTYVFADSDGDGTAEIAIKLKGVIVLGQNDFIGVNDRPTSTDDSVTTNENTTVVLTLGDFGTFADVDGDTLQSVKIVALESNGSLEYDNTGLGNWAAVTLNQVINAAEISAGRLRFVPDGSESGSPYTTISFQVSDGTAFGTAAYTLTVNVVAGLDDGNATVTITGTAQEDSILTANFGDDDPDGAASGVTYQWQRNGVDIGGASAGNYTLVDADVGATITVEVDYTDGQSFLESIESAPTAVVTALDDGNATVTITGTAQEDSILTANFGDDDPDGAASGVTYQWQRNGVDIGGASAGNYTLVDADVGATITVEVDYTDGQSFLESIESAPTAVVTALDDGNATVTITGTAQEDSILTANFGDDDPDGAASGVTYQWQRNGVDIGGASAGNYTLVDADVGATITVEVDYTDGQSFLESIESAPTAVVTALDDGNATVTITGTAQEDSILTANFGDDDPDGAASGVTYQWQRNGVDIGGASAGNYTLVDADVGATITVEVDYTDGQSFLESIESAPTAVVTALDDGNATVTITGTAQEDSILTANFGDDDPDGAASGVTYQWQRNGVDIGGASAGNYTLVDADVGATITVEVDYTDGQSFLESIESAPTAVVTALDDGNATVTITGTAQEDSILTANFGDDDPDGAASGVTYQWQRNGVDIGGASAGNYTLVDADVGATITVEVDYTDGQSFLESIESAPTAAVTAANAEPVANNDIWVVSDTLVAAGIITSAWVTNNDSDSDNDPLFVTAISGLPSGLTANFDGAGHLIDITGTPVFDTVAPIVNSYIITYTLSDGTATDTATATLTVVDTANTGGGDSITLNENDFSYIDGQNGNDTITGDLTLVGAAGIDTFVGGNNNDTLSGGAGADNLFGNDGTDGLSGGEGQDTLNGGNDNDVLAGGAGADNLTGGGGADDFRWNSTAEFGDLIADFAPGSDNLVFDVSVGTINIGDNDNNVENFEANTIALTDDGTSHEVVVVTDDDIDGIGDLGVQGTIDLYNSIVTGALFVFDVGSQVQVWYDPNPSNAGGALLVGTLGVADITTATFGVNDFGFV